MGDAVYRALHGHGRDLLWLVSKVEFGYGQQQPWPNTSRKWARLQTAFSWASAVLHRGTRRSPPNLRMRTAYIFMDLAPETVLAGAAVSFGTSGSATTIAQLDLLTLARAVLRTS